MPDIRLNLRSDAVKGLLADLLGALAVASRRRRVARDRVGLSAPTAPTAPARGLLHAARVHDARCRHLAGSGRLEESLAPARAAAEAWRSLTLGRPGHFHLERQRALGRLDAVLRATGRNKEAASVRREAARVSATSACGPWQDRTPVTTAPRARNTCRPL